MVRTDQEDQLNGGVPVQTGNASYDNRIKKHRTALEAFSVRQKSGITNGVKYDRSPTDCCWCIIFLATVLAMFGCAIYAIATGHPQRLIAPYDSAGNLCGYDKGYEDYTKLYLSDLKAGEVGANQLFATGLCVKSCPNVKETSEWWTANCKTNDVTKSCDLTATQYEADAFGTLCFPTNFDSLDPAVKKSLDDAKKEFLNSEVGKAFADIGKARITMITTTFTALILAIMWMWFMSNCANCLAIISVILILLIFIGGGVFAIIIGAKGGDNTAVTACYVSGGVLLFFGLIFLCCIWCNRTSLETAIAIIDATADFFIDTKRLIFVGFYSFIMAILFFLLWVAAEACVLSLNDFKKGDGSQEKVMTFTGSVMGMMIFQAFAILWIIKFIDDKNRFITMVSAVTYYFSSTASKTGGASVLTGFKFAYFKHQGSLAFGSLIMTLVYMLRCIVDSVANSANSSGDGAAKCIACLARCLVGCLEDLIEYISKTAYAYMAISGDSFCQSAWNGFLLNLKYCSKFYFALNIGGMFVFMGIIACTAANVGIAYLMIIGIQSEKDAIHSYVGPLCCAGAVSFVIACIFLTQFNEAVLATIFCYAVDADLHDGKPQFGPKDYHKKLDKIQGFQYVKKVRAVKSQDPEKGKGRQQQYQPLNSNPPPVQSSGKVQSTSANTMY